VRIPRDAFDRAVADPAEVNARGHQAWVAAITSGQISGPACPSDEDRLGVAASTQMDDDGLPGH
jgi:hypothetical protein